MITTATSAEVTRAGARAAVLPVGSFEQHGAHLPLTTDTLIAQAIAEAVADAYGLLLPPRSRSRAPTNTAPHREP